MKIEITNIPDTNQIRHDSESKILLMDDLVEYFAPLFYEDLRKKQRRFDENQADILKLKQTISDNRTRLISLQKDIEDEKLKNEILIEIEHLNTVDVLYGKNKAIVRDIVITLENQQDQELRKSLSTLQKIINKKG
jgi:hypothetical protein